MVVIDSGSSVSLKNRNGPAPSILRGFQQFVGNGHEELPEQQRAGRRRDQRQDQSRIGVEHVQVRHHLVGRIDAHLDRQHQRDEDDPERGLAERKAEIHHGIGRQDGDEDLAHRDADGGDERIHQQVPDRLASGARAADEDGAVVVFQRAAARRQRHVAADHGRGVMGRGDQREIDRKRDDEYAKREDGVGDDVVPGAVLDHQYCTLRST